MNNIMSDFYFDPNDVNNESDRFPALNYKSIKDKLDVMLSVNHIEHADRLSFVALFRNKEACDNGIGRLGLSYSIPVFHEDFLERIEVNDIDMMIGEGKRIVNRLKNAGCGFLNGELVDEKGNKTSILKYFMYAFRRPLEIREDRLTGDEKKYFQKYQGKKTVRNILAIGCLGDEWYSWIEADALKSELRHANEALKQHLPHIEAVTDVPFLTSQGLALKPGLYKTSTGWKMLKPHAFADVKACSRDKVEEKIKRVLGYFEMDDVEFVDDTSMSNVASSAFTGLYSQSFDIRKGVAVTSRQPDNGKGRLSSLLLSLHPGRHCDFHFVKKDSNEDYRYAAALSGGVSATYWQDVDQDGFVFTPRVKNLLTSCDLKLKNTGASEASLFEGRQFLVVDGRGLTLTNDYTRRFVSINFIRSEKNINLKKSKKFSEASLFDLRKTMFELTLAYIQEKGTADVTESIAWQHYCEDIIPWLGLEPLVSQKDSSISQADIDDRELDMLRVLQGLGKLKTVELLKEAQDNLKFGTVARDFCGIESCVNRNSNGAFLSFKKGLVGRGNGHANIINKLILLKDREIEGLKLRRERGKRGCWYVEGELEEILPGDPSSNVDYPFLSLGTVRNVIDNQVKANHPPDWGYSFDKANRDKDIGFELHGFDFDDYYDVMDGNRKKQ